MRIALAEPRGHFQRLLAGMGHEVVAARSGRRLVEVCHAAGPDLVIADLLLPDTTGVEAAAELSKHTEVPVILAADRDQGELLGEGVVGHVMALLLKPAGEGQLKAAIALAVRRFEQYLAVRDEPASLRQALEGRRVVERAKGALMRRLRVDEEDAFRRLRLLASQTSRKVAEVAREVLRAEEVFRLFEGA